MVAAGGGRSSKKSARFCNMDSNEAAAAPPEVVGEVAKWLSSPPAHRAHWKAKMEAQFRKRLAADWECALEGEKGYRVLFTSAPPSQTLIMAAARAYAARTQKQPHVVVSAADTKAVHDCVRRLEEDRQAQYAELPALRCGEDGAPALNAWGLTAVLRPNTCLVVAAAASADTGAVNDLGTVAGIAMKGGAPLYSDVSQLIGRQAVRPRDLNLAAFGGTFGHLGAPPGVGFLAVRNDLYAGYGLGPYVAESGDAPSIAGAFVAYCASVPSSGDARREATNRVRDLRGRIKKALARSFTAVHIDEYCEARPRVQDENPGTPSMARVGAPPATEKGKKIARLLQEAKKRPVLVWLGPGDDGRALPNTLCVLVADARFDALEAQARLLSMSVAVGVPSGASLDALDVHPELRGKGIRVSLGPASSPQDCDAFVAAFSNLFAGDHKKY